MTWNRFEAELLFLDPNDVPRAVEALAAVGCEFEIDHAAIDDDGPTVFGWVTGTTELSQKTGWTKFSSRSAGVSMRWALGGTPGDRRRDAAMKFPSQTDSAVGGASSPTE